MRFNAFAEAAADGGALVAALITSAAIFNHSCAPAATWHIAESSREMIVTAARDLAAGEEVTLSYVAPSPAALLKDAPARWRHISEQWDFLCACELCQQEALALMQVGGAPGPLVACLYSLQSGISAAVAHEGAGALGDAAAAWTRVHAACAAAPALAGSLHQPACEAALHVAQLSLLQRRGADAAAWVARARASDAASGRPFERWGRLYAVVGAAS